MGAASRCWWEGVQPQTWQASATVQAEQPGSQHSCGLKRQPQDHPPGMGWDGMGWDVMGCDGMGWYGMVWCGMVWYGMVWYGMVWYGSLSGCSAGIIFNMPYYLQGSRLNKKWLAAVNISGGQSH